MPLTITESVLIMHTTMQSVLIMHMIGETQHKMIDN